jgi:hypothetical protein
MSWMEDRDLLLAETQVLLSEFARANRCDRVAKRDNFLAIMERTTSDEHMRYAPCRRKTYARIEVFRF